MLCALTVRRLRPGVYEEFRSAWQPDPWPSFLARAYLMRNQDDPDEVAAVGFLDLSLDELDAVRDDTEFLATEARRIERIAPYEERVVLNSIYEVAEEVLPPDAKT
jgi:hypothetical protein